LKDSILLTIVAGVSVFVIGQFILKLVLDPLVSFKNVLGELSAFFLREQAKITNAHATDEVQAELKRLASSILAAKHAIPFYGLWRLIFMLPSERAIVSACQSLNWIATFSKVDSPRVPPKHDVPLEIHNEMKNINRKLKIRVTYSEL
jgi:hypothetical protein